MMYLSEGWQAVMEDTIIPRFGHVCAREFTISPRIRVLKLDQCPQNWNNTLETL